MSLLPCGEIREIQSAKMEKKDSIQICCPPLCSVKNMPFLKFDIWKKSRFFLSEFSKIQIFIWFLRTSFSTKRKRRCLVLRASPRWALLICGVTASSSPRPMPARCLKCRTSRTPCERVHRKSPRNSPHSAHPSLPTCRWVEKCKIGSIDKFLEFQVFTNPLILPSI